MIRHADLKDFNRIMELMVNFANSAPVEAYHDPQYNYRGVQHFLAGVKNAGCILVAEHEGTIQGMLIAQVLCDPWLPHIKTMKEMAWWVEPEYRHTSMGYRLLMEYVKFGKELQSVGVIENFVLTNMTISPDFDLEKRGWRPIETNYVYEGVN
jgi:N-acetylglutamate synthase-like GNAT family acetyltransferase